MGVDVVIYANVVMRAITKGVGDVLEVLREERLLRATDGRIAPLEALFELTDAYGWIHARPTR